MQDIREIFQSFIIQAGSKEDIGNFPTHLLPIFFVLGVVQWADARSSLWNLVHPLSFEFMLYLFISLLLSDLCCVTLLSRCKVPIATRFSYIFMIFEGLNSGLSVKKQNYDIVWAKLYLTMRWG